MLDNKQKKILHIGKYHPPFMGGIENFMAVLMQQQHNDGYAVSAIVHHHEAKKGFVIDYDKSVKIHRVPSLGQVAYAPIAPLFANHLNKLLKQDTPDILHIHMPNLSAFWCLLLPLARKIPWVIHWHADVMGSVPDLKIKLLYPFYQIFELALLKKTTKIIATSPIYLESSEPLKRFNSKVSIVPLGLDYNDCIHSTQSLSIEKAINPVNIKLLMIGRLTYYKGHKIIFSALAKLKNKGIRFTLTIVGGGELLAELKQEITQLDLNDEIKLLGKLSNQDLNYQLTHTDLLCLPSIERTEAFGVVLLEAMRASKPCLVSDVKGSGMSWVVQDNITGFVVKHNNIDSLVDKLVYISENTHLLNLYGDSGQKRFDDIFNIKAVSFDVTAIYNQVLENK